MTQSPASLSSSNHHPFRLRKIIVFFSLAVGVVGACLWGYPVQDYPGQNYPVQSFFPFDYPWQHNFVLGLAFYFCSVTFLDFWIHTILEKKASTYSDPEQLLESERVNGKELDRYFETRKKIRMVSFSIAGLVAWTLSQFFPYGLQIFCLVYILSTLAGILQVRLSPQIKRPRLLYRDDRYYHPPIYKPFYHMDYLNWYFGRGPLP